MRQFGYDPRCARPSWRCWGFRRVRRRDLCDLLESFYPGVPFPEFDCGLLPPDLGPGVALFPTEFPRGGRMRFLQLLQDFGVGPGCPNVLIQQGFIGQDPLALTQLALAGVPIPTNERLNRFGFQGGFILQLRKNPADGVSVRRCTFVGREADGRELVGELDGLPALELSGLGFI